ncbi:DUF2062 domain-containing protein [Phyllobacterium sp. 22229]|uniref:DUF2062 domain-containing protein n=1 Tax=Phyllobacterium myrsinacearum TaxID=28101 RepID=A0A2S9JE71_9HYPH|nr:DUF2062 domain-containing protein [Phyllobacterium myrsinacearum]PRD51082.1 DUF2062 domain-containing protein [Phyllobacterium myrsinacearum]PWV88207.1 hypothetical protein DEV92_11114 [Phyllobacterium myrsinacearum]RZS88649.1 hypothetical protein EV217_1036 [Phyllobacterium myrsinacearum]RZU97498.1 hypothetical protein EV654_4358 [Phyllobacterium myrsinacearum]
MLFKRRIKPGFRERMRTALWPRRSVGRSLRYFGKRVLRLRATPHAIAAGLAAGIFSSFIPILGVHIAVALAIAWIIGGNIAAAILGTTLGNPLFLPFIWGATLEAGRFILSGGPSDEPFPHHLGHMLRHLDFAELWGPIVKPMLIGAVPLGFIAALVVYFPTRWIVASFQNRRKAGYALEKVAEPS